MFIQYVGSLLQPALSHGQGGWGGGVRAPRLVLSVKDLQGSWKKVKMNQGFIALSQSYKEREKDFLV